MRPLLLAILLLALAGCGGGRDANSPRLSLDAVRGVAPKHVGEVSGRKYFAYELTESFDKVREEVAAQLSKEGWKVQDGDATFSQSKNGEVVEFVAIKKGRLTSDGMNLIPDASHTVVTIHESIDRQPN